MKKTSTRWRSFQIAKEWAQSLGLTSETQWRVFRKAGLPTDIPSNPNREYADDWKGWGDWLGTERVASQHKHYRSYQEASDWAKTNGIKKLNDWKRITSEPTFPSDIPIVPYNTYRDEWVSWGSFLQTGYVHYKARSRATFEEAKAWAKEMRVYTSNDWYALAKQGRMPPEIPVNIAQYYEEWSDWSNFLDNKIKGGASIVETVISKELCQFFKVDESVRTIRLKTGRYKRVDIVLPDLNMLIEYDGAHWHKNQVEKDRRDNELLGEVGWRVLRIRELPLERISPIDLLVDPKDSLYGKMSSLLKKLVLDELIPNSPEIQSYLKSGKLSSRSIGIQENNWLSFSEAKRWVSVLALKSETEWRRHKKFGVLPEVIPATPEEAYRTEWLGWGDFLGTGNKAPSKNMKPFGQARDYIRALNLKDSRAWRRFVKTEMCPDDIPSSPDTFYKEWVSWMDWLGTEHSAKRKRNWLSFEEAVLLSRSLNLKSESEWRKARKNGRIPPELPAAPEQLYKAEWQGWKYWLGTLSKNLIFK